MRIFLIIALTILLVGCEDLEHKKAVQNNVDNGIIITDEHGVEYTITIIEGCEYYLYKKYRQMGIVKVDCDCIADKSKRK